MRENELIIYRSDANNGFRIDYDYYYQESRINTDWENPLADISDKLRFLNRFLCHLPYAIANALQVNLEIVSPLFAQVRTVEIQDLNLREDIFQIIKDIFYGLKNNVNNFKDTAASKFMHMTCPNLFFMADSVIVSYLHRRNIISQYFVADDYVRLLQFYCQEINELIDDIMQNHRLNRLEAVRRIREKDEFALGSIPRIIDKHFYWNETH